MNDSSESKSKYVEPEEIDWLIKEDYSMDSVAHFLDRHPDWAPIFDERGELTGLRCETLQKS